MKRVAILDGFGKQTHGYMVVGGFVKGLKAQGVNVTLVNHEKKDINGDKEKEYLFHYDINDDGKADVEVIGIDDSKVFHDRDDLASLMGEMVEEKFGKLDAANFSFGYPYYPTELQASRVYKQKGFRHMEALADQGVATYVAAGNDAVTKYNPNKKLWQPENFLNENVNVVCDENNFDNQGTRIADSDMDFNFIREGKKLIGFDMDSDDVMDVPLFGNNIEMDGEKVGSWKNKEGKLASGVEANGTSFGAPFLMGEELELNS